MAGASLGGMSGMHEQGGCPSRAWCTSSAVLVWRGRNMTPRRSGLAAEQLEKTILEVGEDNVAAFIADPIQGAGGVIIPPDTYWPKIKEILARYDILFVADEVICGFGRTGSGSARTSTTSSPT
ncbi:aminotransferase class III-fold pyridoxal phosphate-dependent enzyme [Rhodococcus hoagii]|nr:aminotransferase class III-fold pyridoxal phosphate-dependent enzyme [Prescottella equi]